MAPLLLEKITLVLCLYFLFYILILPSEPMLILVLTSTYLTNIYIFISSYDITTCALSAFFILSPEILASVIRTFSGMSAFFKMAGGDLARAPDPVPNRAYQPAPHVPAFRVDEQSTHDARLISGSKAGAEMLNTRYPYIDVEATIDEIRNHIHIFTRLRPYSPHQAMYDIASRSIDHIISLTSLYSDPGNISPKKFLALGWKALLDDDPSTHPENYDLNEAKVLFFTTLCDIIRGANSPNRDYPICSTGTFNKIHEALCHKIVGFHQTMGSTKSEFSAEFVRLVKKLWSECDDLKDLHELHISSYNKYLKQPVRFQLIRVFSELFKQSCQEACFQEVEADIVYIELNPTLKSALT
jgi:hypothetical protein